MSPSKAQLGYSRKYIQEKIDELRLRVPKGQRAIIHEHANKMGESTNAFLKRAVAETMERDTKKSK